MNLRLPLLTGCVFAGIFFGQNLELQSQIQLEIQAESVIDFSSDRSSFTLNFSHFRSGSLTDAVSVNYSVVANDVARTDHVVLARLDDLFPGITFEAEFGAYVKRGGNAHLVASQSGWVSVTQQDTGLADKVIDEGEGKMLDGTFGITYQAKAIEDLEAGQHLRTLTVTFTDV